MQINNFNDYRILYLNVFLMNICNHSNGCQYVGLTTATNRFVRFVALMTERLPFNNHSITGRTDLKPLVLC